MNRIKIYRMKLSQSAFIVILLIAFSSLSNAQSITVIADKITAHIQPTMWGIFFEDINFAADGGLYAELVKNRSFEFAAPMMGWTIQQQTPNTGTVLVTNRLETDTANPRYIRVTRNTETGNFGLTND